MAEARIHLPSDAVAARLRAEGYEISDEERERHHAFLAEAHRLARLVASPLCGLTSRPGPWRVPAVVQYAPEHPPITLSRRFSGMEVAVECGLWVKWLMDVLDLAQTWTPAGERVAVPLAVAKEHLPPPPGRPFFAPQVWPTIGHGPEVKTNRRGRARRS